VAFELGGEGLTALPDGPRLPYLLDEAPLGVAQLDREGRVEACNAAFHAMAGGGDCLGRPLAELLRAEDRAALAEALPRLAGGVGPVNLRFTGRGERAATLYGASGEAAGRPQSTIAYFVDMTEQRRLEMQFAQSQKMQAVGQLAGGVAHDFNNLLTAMIGFCDLLLLRHRAGDQSFADIMQIKQNGNRAASLVRQLLAFSRQQTLQPRVLAITDVLAELSHLLRRLIGANIELEMTHGRDLYPVLADPSQIEQVIINLAVNARDAMPNGGRLAIRTANITIKPGQVAPHSHGDALSPGDYLRIGVADSGTGIDPVIIDRIFDPFFSTKEVGAGTGLGLATVYGIVKQTGGSIYVDSTPGAGAVFTLYLPRHTGPESVEVHRREADIAGARRDLTGIGTVLLVEDEDAVRLFGARALRNKGYSVLEARSGEAALEILGQHQETIDLVITDVVMPRMDGPALVRRLRELRPQTKVIFISGYAEDEFRRRLHEESDIHFLPKPFTLKQLASKVKDVLREGEA
jgi:two-component system cell cycle sensor histidine kinase/response regulator CckA